MGLKLYKRVRTLDLPHAEKVLLLDLAIYATDEDGGDIFPCVHTLGENLNLHPSGIKRRRAALVRKGLLSIDPRYPGGGCHKSAHYAIILDAVAAWPKVRTEPISAVKAEARKWRATATVSGETGALQLPPFEKPARYSSETGALQLPVRTKYVPTKIVRTNEETKPSVNESASEIDALQAPPLKAIEAKNSDAVLGDVLDGRRSCQ